MVHWKKSIIIFFGVLALLQSAISAAEVKRMRLVMGTLLEISAQAQDEKTAEKAVEDGFKEMERLDSVLSNYREESEISKMNREAFPDFMTTTQEVIDLIRTSNRFSEQTSGAFDITVEPLTKLWKLKERELKQFPTQEAIEQAKNKVGYKNIVLEKNQVRFIINGMGLDTGGIGKGYALDKGLEKMKAEPIDSAILNFGGEILYWSKDRKKRSFAVKDPIHPDRIWKTVTLSGSVLTAGVATSGNYERSVTFLSPDGKKEIKKLGHILNPKTGLPVDNEIRSVTVIAPKGMDADVFSTAFFVMGLQEAKRFSDPLEDIGVYILYEKQGKLNAFESKGWKKYGT